MKIRSESVTAQVVSYLRERITSGDWAVGEPIPSETRLVSELGVSRASVRSAIQYFIALGAL